MKKENSGIVFTIVGVALLLLVGAACVAVATGKWELSSGDAGMLSLWTIGGIYGICDGIKTIKKNEKKQQ